MPAAISAGKRYGAQIHERTAASTDDGTDGPSSQESGDRKVVQFTRLVAGVLEKVLARSPEAVAALRRRCDFEIVAVSA